MAKRSKSTQLGIEFGAGEIRVVETLGTGAKAVLVSAGSIALPTGALSGGRILHPETLSHTLRRLLETLRVSSDQAILSVPSGGAICRLLNMPPAPPEELKLLVEGEVRHYQILRSDGGVYDYFNLDSTGSSSQENSVVVLGAEDDVTGPLRDVATRAGLDVVALEPTWIGAYRGAYDQISEGVVLFIFVADASVDLVVFNQGSPILYRHIELGMNSFLADLADYDERLASDGATRVTERMPNGREVIFLKGPLDTLAVDLRRSLDFVQREFGDRGRVESVVLAGNHYATPALLETVRATLGIEARLATPKSFTAADESTKKLMAGESGFQYLSAYGLANHGTKAADSSVPTIDLAVRERALVRQEGERRILTGALAASIALVAVAGGAFSYLISQSNEVNQGLTRAKSRIAALEQQVQRSLQEESSKASQLDALSVNAVDVVPLMDILSDSLDDQVGVKQVNMARAIGVRVSGESPNEAAVVRTVDSLQTNVNLQSVSLSSFEKAESEAGRAVRYQLSMMPTGYGVREVKP